MDRTNMFTPSRYLLSAAPLRIPSFLSTSHSDELCSIRPQLSPILEQYGGTANVDESTQGALSKSLSAPALGATEDTFGVHVGSDEDRMLHVPPGLGYQDAYDSSYGELESYHTACDFLDFGSGSELDISHARLPLIRSSGSVQHSPSSLTACMHTSTTNKATRKFSLSSLHFLGTLGRGGNGKVLLARLADSSEYAVKVVGKNHMTRDDILEIKTEVRLLQVFSQRNDTGAAFVQTMDAAFQTRDHVFLVLARHGASLAHPTVRARLRLRPYPDTQPAMSSFPNSVSLPIAFPSCSSISTSYEEVLNTLRLLGAELVLGLQFLHSIGVVHQDIKPANVLISSDGHGIITDFGSAKLLPPSPFYHSTLDDSPDFSCNAHRPSFGSIILHADDQVSYTRRYAAPELLDPPPGMEGRSILMYDERVDYYSLGVMLRELALGTTSEDHKADFGDRWECASDGAKRESEEADADFMDFTYKLLAHDPDERLHGTQTKAHPFLDPISGLWDDISALRYPPFSETVWPEAEEDTRLDLRAYSGDDGDDSFEDEGLGQDWLEELADIPFDSLHERDPPEDKLPPHTTPDQSEELVAHSTIHLTVQLEPATPVCVSTSPRQVMPLPSLSRLPTIPSLDTYTSNAVTESTAKKHPMCLVTEHLDSISGQLAGPHARPLRRRPMVYDLRRAFKLRLPPVASVDALSHLPGGRHRTVTANARYASRTRNKRSGGLDLRYTPWSFEHEITIALLEATKVQHTTVTSSREPPAQSLGRFKAPSARVSISRARVGATRGLDAYASLGEPKQQTKRWRPRSVLCKLKDLAS